MSINQKSGRQTFRRTIVSGSIFRFALPAGMFHRASETKIEPDRRLDLRENILSEMRAIGKKIKFFITGDKFRTFLDMPSFAPSSFFDTSGFVEMLWNLNGGIVFHRSRYEKRAGSRSLSH